MELRTGTRTYSCRTLIGNWSEELQIEEERLRDFESRKQGGKLLSAQLQEFKGIHFRPVSISPQQPDKFVRFNDYVSLYSLFSKSFFSANLCERLTSEPHEFWYACTTAVSRTPVARNVVRLVRYEKQRLFIDDGIIRYGDKFYLVMEDLANTPLYVVSKAASPLNSSKLSGLQISSVSTRKEFDAVWEFVHPDPQFRPDMEGEPVQSDSVVLVSHAPTGRRLGVSGQLYRNEFGVEKEVVCHTFQRVERRFRVETEENHWKVVLALSTDENNFDLSNSMVQEQ